MPVEIRQGDLFAQLDAQVIGHGVNVDGVMGAGIAVQFKKRWPEMFRQYKLQCVTANLHPGNVFLWDTGIYCMDDDPLLIANLASQNRPGPHARYDWLMWALIATLRACKVLGLNSIALPQIGCGIGGLEWDIVLENITHVSEWYPDIKIILVEYKP